MSCQPAPKELHKCSPNSSGQGPTADLRDDIGEEVDDRLVVEGIGQFGVKGGKDARFGRATIEEGIEAVVDDRCEDPEDEQ